MPTENVQTSAGALKVAVEMDAQGVAHQSMVNEFMHGDNPVPVSTLTPVMMESPAILDLLGAILVELRVSNDMFYRMFNTEVEPLELMRNEVRNIPINPGIP